MSEDAPKPARHKLMLDAWGPRVFFESFLIVFSVLFALAINGWREDAASRRQALLAVAGIRAELEENLSKVGATADYNESLVAHFQEAEAAGLETPDPAVVGRGLIRTATVLDSSWAAAQNTDLAKGVSYETILALSSVYALQEEYVTVNLSIADVFYDQLVTAGLDQLLLLYPNLSRVVQDSAVRERALEAAYEDVLEQLPDTED